jgi:hypothetical protein
MKESVLSALFVSLGSGLAVGLQSTLTNWAGRLIGSVRSGLVIIAGAAYALRR